MALNTAFSLFPHINRRSPIFYPSSKTNPCHIATCLMENVTTKKTVDPRFQGRVLSPVPLNGGAWDALLFSVPLVVRTDQGGWRMYYSGRGEDTWHQGVKALPGAPFGRVGLAVSEDGVIWERFDGPLAGGALFDPSDNPTAFDSVQIGASDVCHLANGDWRMYYYGGGMEEKPLPGWPNKMSYKGTVMRPGLATSRDGLTWQRSRDFLLDVGLEGEWDSVAVAWPRVINLGPQEWLMFYQTVGDSSSPAHVPPGEKRNHIAKPPGGGYCYTVGVAVSPDGASNWVKKGPCLFRGAPGTWDEAGVNKRHVIKVNDTWLMFYEGMNYSGEYAIGLATSADAYTWQKDERAGPEPGGPVLRARRGEDVWDNWLVSAPHVVQREDGALWMYYVGVGEIEGQGKTRGVGIAVSNGTRYWEWNRML